MRKGLLMIVALTLKVVCPTLLLAQVNPQKGYVITNENDTIYGTIDYLSYKKNCKECHFIPQGLKKIVVYKPTDLLGYRFSDNSAYYVRRQIDVDGKEKTVFVELLVEGGVSLYFYSGKDDYYFFEGTDGALCRIKDDHLSILDMQGEYAEKMRSRRKSMEGLFTVFTRDIATCRELWMMEFSPKKATMLVKNYNNRFCQDAGECIVYESEIEKQKMLDVYLWAAAGVTSNKIKVNYDPIEYSAMQTCFSVGADLSLPQYSKSLFLQFAVSVGRWTFPDSWAYARTKSADPIKVTSVETMIGAGYCFLPDKVICPFVVGDICLLGRQFYPEMRRIYTYTDGTKNPEVWKHEDIDNAYNCTSYRIGAGVNLWKLLRLEVAYKKSSSWMVKENGVCFNVGLRFHL